MIATVLVFGLVFASAVTDMLRHKIYNVVTYPGICIAFILNLLGETIELEWIVALDAANRADWQAFVGWIGLGESLLGFLACGLILVVCYVFFEVGGGDVKLLTMVGAYLGVYEGIEVLLWSFVLGGAFALIMILWCHGVWSLMQDLFQRLRLATQGDSIRTLTESQPQESTNKSAALYLAPSTLVALIVVKFINLHIM